MQLDVECEEKCEFTRFYHQGEHERSERVSDEHEGFEFKANIFDLTAYNKMFNIGNYAIQFQFVLPNPLPSSLKFKAPADRSKPEAKVEHRVKIKLKDTQFKDAPQFRKEFKVRNDALLAKGAIPNQEKT